VAGAFSDNEKTILQRMAEIVLAAVHRAVQSVEAKPVAMAGPSTRAASSERLLMVPDEEVEGGQEPPPVVPAPVARVQEPEQIFSQPSRRIRIPWLLLAAIGIGVLVGIWLIVSGWRQPSSSSSVTPTPSQTEAADRKQLIEASSLDDLKTFANRGDSIAEFDLGLRYATGTDVPQDYGEAVRWFSQAAEKGHVLAQSTLGAYYWAGRGVPQNFNKAYFWALLAQSGGDEASRARVPFLASRMTRQDILAVQEQANDWSKLHRQTGKPTPAHQ
jgi:hypothetical protein